MSDSSDFESADEGVEHAQRKNKSEDKTQKPPSKEAENNENEGWENDDWDDLDADTKSKDSPKAKAEETKPKPAIAEDADGWDNWNDDSPVKTPHEDKQSNQEHSQKEFQALADRLSSLGGKSETAGGSGGGWGGWGNWGVTDLLSTGVSQLTNHVSQGFASVSQAIESGMGVPEPEEMAKLHKSKSKELKETETEDKNDKEKNESINHNTENSPQVDSQDDMLGVFKIGKLVSNVSKLVETTGTAVVTGGIDTLEEIGKRTMRVLQGEDEGKKRLTNLFQEALQYTEQRPPDMDIQENDPKKKAPQFDALFDDFQGLVHLEALEMLSKQCSLKIQTLLNTYQGKELAELKETLEQVKEICDLPDPDDDDKDENSSDQSSSVLRIKLTESVKDMGVQLQFDPIIECWEKIITSINENEDESTDNDDDEDSRQAKLVENAEKIMIDAISNIAQCSALSVQLLHRSTALLSVRERRSTADEADGLTQLTTVLTSHISEVAALYSQKLNQVSQLCKDSSKISELITSVFLEAGKGTTYVQDAFALTIPILQVGAT